MKVRGCVTSGMGSQDKATGGGTDRQQDRAIDASYLSVQDGSGAT